MFEQAGPLRIPLAYATFSGLEQSVFIFWDIFVNEPPEMGEQEDVLVLPLLLSKASDEEEELEWEDPSEMFLVRVPTVFITENVALLTVMLWAFLFSAVMLALLSLQYSSRDFSLWMGGIASSL